MYRTRTLLLTFCVFLFACGILPSSGIGSPDINHPTGTAAAEQSTSTSSASHDSLTDIPLKVGYGVHGSWFDLYFTDPANPAGNQITGGPDGPLIAAVDSARVSVDAAIYSLSLNGVRTALIQAHRRGVQVRVVMESDNMDSQDPQLLKDAGIPLLGDRREGLMHNKFVVIDRSEVWTGSMNFTNDGTYADNNNMMHIRSLEIAEDYEAEFNEMFVDDKFGTDNGTPTPNPRITIDGTQLDVYFSPDDHVQAALVDLLDQAQKSINFLAYSFTADPLSDVIRKRAKAGVKVSGVMESEQVISNIGSEFDVFKAAGLDIHLDGNKGQMHHKVMIIDGQIVVMGSYNFSASAEKTNDENVIIIYSPEIAGQYQKEFLRVYKASQP